VRSSVVSHAMECITGSVTVMVGVGGMLVTDAERYTVTLRWFMRPYPADNDCEPIAVELVSCSKDDEGEGPVKVSIQRSAENECPSFTARQGLLRFTPAQTCRSNEI